jgi:3-dehydroquinate synthase
MQGDKKVRAEQLRFVGVSEVGKPVWFEGVERELAKTIYERILQ